MVFAVKTRLNGKLEEIQIEAADRQAVWAELEKRGVKSVVSVSEVGAASVRPASISPQVRKGLVAGLLIVALAALGFWLFVSQDEKSSRAGDQSDGARAIQDAERRAESVAQTQVLKPDKPLEEKSQTARKKPGFFVRVEKLPDGNEKRWTANGECYYVDLSRSHDDSKPTYTNEVEALLSMYVHPGEDMPPPPDDDISDVEALAACKIPIYAFPGDSDAILDEREVVQELKQDLQEYIENGGHARDYIRELIDRQNNEAQYVSETRERVEELIRQDDCVLAAKFLKEMNNRLAEKGIPPVRLSSDYQSMLDEIEAESKVEKGVNQ